MIKYKGMTLLDFLLMWELDGTKMYEQQRQSLNGNIWILYAVCYPGLLTYYERHGALIVKIDAQTEVVLMHVPYVGECKVSGSNYSKLLVKWFEENIEKYGAV